MTCPTTYSSKRKARALARCSLLSTRAYYHRVINTLICYLDDVKTNEKIARCSCSDKTGKEIIYEKKKKKLYALNRTDGKY